MQKGIANWPIKRNVELESPEDSDTVSDELKKICCVAETQNKEDSVRLNELIDCTRYSSLHRLLRVTAWVRRFVWNAKYPEERMRGKISSEEIFLQRNP